MKVLAEKWDKWCKNDSMLRGTLHHAKQPLQDLIVKHLRYRTGNRVRVYRYQDGSTQEGVVKECIIKRDDRDYYRIGYAGKEWEIVDRFQLWIGGVRQDKPSPCINSYPPWGAAPTAQSHAYTMVRNKNLEWATNKVKEAMKHNVLER